MTYPIPNAIALAHSEKLIAHIRHEIKLSNAPLSFARFMELALYTPGLGYYSAGSHKLGKEGDFITAPEISPLFAQCIAKQCQQAYSEIGASDFLEIGAGSGIFAKDILLALEKLNALPQQYFILEISAELRERQEKILKKYCSHLFSRIHWLESLPQEFNGIIFANEVLDAMPAHCFYLHEKTTQERCVIYDKNTQQFSWTLTTPSKELADRIQQLPIQPQPGLIYTSEIHLSHPAWISSLAAILKKGLILLFDYGYGRNEYYHPDRGCGTLMCFYQHHKHTNPFIYVGLQDITAHVDFTTIAESAVDAALSIGGYTTQAGFLLACGLLDIADTFPLSDSARFQQNQAIKTLTLPSQMGEIVKVMALKKNLDIPLLGFQLQDRRRDL